MKRNNETTWRIDDKRQDFCGRSNFEEEIMKQLQESKLRDKILNEKSDEVMKFCGEESDTIRKWKQWLKAVRSK